MSVMAADDPSRITATRPAAITVANDMEVLRQEVGHRDGLASERERLDGGWRHQPRDRAIVPSERCRLVRLGVAIDLHGMIDEVHDPVVRDGGARVEAALVNAIEAEARFRHFDG